MLPRKVKEGNFPREGEGIRKDEREGERGDIMDILVWTLITVSGSDFWKLLVDKEQMTLRVFAQSVGPWCHCGTVFVGWIRWYRSEGGSKGSKVQVTVCGMWKHLVTGGREKKG